MKKLLKGLVYDKNLISSLKQANLTEDFMYNQLMSGKITLKEYLRLTK